MNVKSSHAISTCTFEMTTTTSHAPVKVSWDAMTLTDGKRKCDAMNSPNDGKKGLFTSFSSSKSPCTSSRSSKSPSSSSPRKKSNLIIKQGANQNNKILRYLQPKRLFTTFSKDSSVPTSPSVEKMVENDVDKENKVMELKVTLVRIDDATKKDHSYCMEHRIPKKFHWNAAAETVIYALSNRFNEDISNPCKRLGIQMPVCATSAGCTHSESTISSTSFQDSLHCTMVNADLQVTMLRSCFLHLSSKAYPSPSTVHSVFRIMKESADKNILALGRSFLKRLVKCHPPCSLKQRNYYIYILNSPKMKESMPAGLWSLRRLELFEETLSELENHIDGLLNPRQLKAKLKLPGVRKITKPKRFRNSPSPEKKIQRRGNQEVQGNKKGIEEIHGGLDSFSQEAIKKRLSTEKAIREMSASDKTYHIFCRFEILVDILEWDLVMWLSHSVDFTKVRDRTVCPLIVLSLWRPESDTGFDSIHCRRILSMYGSACTLKLDHRYITTLSRLIGLVAEVTSASETNIGNVFPHVGDGCENLARKLCDVLRRTEPDPVTQTKAISVLRPDWLKMLVSASLLGVSPTISSLDMRTLHAPKSDLTIYLWTSLLESVMEFYHIKETMNLLKQVSQDYIKNDQPPQQEALAKGYQMNYRNVLQEVVAFHGLSCQISECENAASIPNLLLEILKM